MLIVERLVSKRRVVCRDNSSNSLEWGARFPLDYHSSEEGVILIYIN